MQAGAEGLPRPRHHQHVLGLEDGRGLLCAGAQVQAGPAGHGRRQQGGGHRAVETVRGVRGVISCVRISFTTN